MDFIEGFRPLVPDPGGGAAGGIRILVLGSFPSEKSLARGQYYGNPRNHFWAIVADCLGVPAPPPATYEERAAMLASGGVAVWDLYASVRRAKPGGSLDSDLRDAAPNPIGAFVAAYPSIGTVVLNGGTAAAAFRRLHGAELSGSGALLEAVGDKAVWTPGEGPPGGPSPSLRAIRVFRVPSSSPVPTRAFRRAADKLPAWRRAFGKA